MNGAAACRLLLEDHLHVLETAAVAFEHQLGARHRGCRAALAPLGVGDEDELRRGEIAAQQHIEKSALAGNPCFRHACDRI